LFLGVYPPNGLATSVIFWTSRAAGSHEQIFGVNEQILVRGPAASKK